jgi:molybdopterin/thiamine biosynthesis adenylyltransferase
VALANVEPGERLLDHLRSRSPGSLLEKKLRARNQLVFAGPELKCLRTNLLAASPLESAAFVFARPVRTPSGKWRLVVHDWYMISDDDYAVRSEVGIDLPPRVVAVAMKRAKESQSAVVLVHSHPGIDPTPSPRDRRGESVLVPAFRRWIPAAPIARLILSPQRLSAAVLTDAGLDEDLEVTEVGAQIRNSNHSDDTRRSEQRFDRQVRAFGDEGQASLAEFSVSIVGLGGTGSVIAQQLAHLGISKFLLVDPDNLDETNLNRVVGSRLDDVGTPKVDVAAAMIHRINPDAHIIVNKGDVRDQPIVRELLNTDFFFCCTDSQGSRAVLTQFAYQYVVPGIDMGVAIYASEGNVSHISGRVQMLAPGLPCLLCASVLDPERVRRELLTDEARSADKYIIGDVVPQPAVISINSAACSLAVTMFLSAVAGIPVMSRHQRLRLESGIVSPVETRASDHCPWCSQGGAMARGDSWPMPGRSA